MATKKTARKTARESTGATVATPEPTPIESVSHVIEDFSSYNITNATTSRVVFDITTDLGHGWHIDLLPGKTTIHAFRQLGTRKVTLTPPPPTGVEVSL